MRKPFKNRALTLLGIFVLGIFTMIIFDACSSKRGVCGLTKRQGRAKQKSFGRMVRF